MDLIVQNKLPHCKALRGSKLIDRLKAVLESPRWMIWISRQP